MADLLTVATFFQNADAFSEFRHRVAVALVKYAKEEREETAPDPVTDIWVARQNYCLQILNGKTGALNAADQMMPALAVVADAASLIDEEGNITATDQQIIGIIDDDLLDVFAGYVPEAA